MNPKYVAAASAATLAAAAALIPNEQETKSLNEYQYRCTQALSYFITQIPKLEPAGKRTITFGESYRPEATALIYAKRGIGIAQSLHTQRLAFDLNLFVDGTYRGDGEAYKPLAELWMAIGGEFGIVPAAGYYFNDGNHFSCKYGGRK